MLNFLHSRRMASVLLLCGSSVWTSACATSSSNGAGYQFVHYEKAATAIAVSQDALAGPVVNSNNEQCLRDEACKK